MTGIACLLAWDMPRLVPGRWFAAGDLCADVFKHVRLRLLRLVLMAQ